MKSTLPLAVIIFCVASSVVNASELVASNMVGRWQCSAKNNDMRFDWIVKNGAPQGWLTGEVFFDDERAAFEGWAYDENGRLADRRQFGRDGRFVHMQVVQRAGSTLISEGSAYERDGSQRQLRHKVTMTEAGRLDVIWEVKRDEEYSVVTDEICVLGNTE
ncbi:MAG: hypothetical protein AAF936_18355 [Pseudomonadota bacterium]